MEILFWIAVFGCILAFIIYQGKEAEREWERRKMLGFPKEAPRLDDSIEAARQALHFINDRLDGRPDKWESCKKTGASGYFTMLDSVDIAEFFRYAHFAGCEVVIRQVSKEDIEDPKNTRKAFEEWVSDMHRAAVLRWEREHKLR